MRLYPVFGRRPSKTKVQAFRKSEHLVDGKFVNLTSTIMDTSLKTMYSTLKDFIKGNPNGRPHRPLPMANTSFQQSNHAQFTWFGHSASMLNMEGKTLLLDPMFGNAPSPLPSFGIKRYSGGLPFKVEELPVIDAVLLSHDHYDHLDYGSIRKIKHKVNNFLVPLGVGSHLERWGVDPAKIQEYDWWDELQFEGLTLVCTPAKHFSGRSLSDRNATLWCSWVIKGEHTRVFFSGDSGYAPHFKEIGDKYGPFDLALIECGQYDERWADIHMMPEESVQAHLDVNAKLMIPIHWAGFTLAFHDWMDPIERVTRAAKARNVAISTPKIGETVFIGAADFPQITWWRQED
ncbi:MBL fold metallo-hydrolase [Paenibacillus sp. WST5]|uniref:MBL fold metallo-hydrolase n=2 Tax=Paenibacillus sedimenti TaxID=2770274 RepID=A0A926KMS0_9BACL|nr:MBL fold metallo-hydrolase [Paenibacillus sedimenti]